MSPNPQRLWTPVPWWPNRTPGRVWLPGNQFYVSEQPPQRRQSSIYPPGKSACGSCCHYPNHWTCPHWILLYPSVFLILLNAVVQCFCELKIYLYPQSIFFNKKSEGFKHWYQTWTDWYQCLISVLIRRHVLRFMMSGPLGYCVHLVSTVPFVFGNEEEVMPELTKVRSAHGKTGYI